LIKRKFTLKNKLLLTFFIYFFVFCVSAQEFKNSFLHLDSNFFQQKKVIPLKTSWEMYWKDFIFPQFFHKTQGINIDLPRYWDGLTINKTEIDGTGFATFRLQIISPAHNDQCAIFIPEILTTYRCFWNGKIIAQNGEPSAKQNFISPKIKPQIIPIILLKDTNEIVFHISNYIYRSGGFFHIPEIGNFQMLSQDHFFKMAYDLILFGSLMIMIIYHTALYIMRRRTISALFFALCAFDIAIWTLFSGELIASYFFPEISWELFYKILNLSFFCASPLYFLFFKSLFPEESNKIIIYAFCGVTFGLALVCLFTFARIYSFLVFYTEILIVLGALCVFTFLGKAIKKRKEGSIEFTIGLTVILFTFINDVLINQAVIHSWIYLMPVGMFVFTFVQSYILAKKFTAAFYKNEALTQTLDFQNKNLEEIVNERTAEIAQQKEEILVQAEALQSANDTLSESFDFLNEQKEEIEEAHEQITASIRYAKRIQTAVLPSQEIISALLPEHFILFRPRDIVSGDFYFVKQVKNYLYIAAADCTGHGVPGAFMSMLGITLLNEILNNAKYKNAAEILNELRVQIKNSLQQTGQLGEQQDGMDIAFCSINLENNVLSFAGAHNPCWVFRKNHFFELPADRMPVGIFQKEKPFTENTFQLEKNDVIYLFSDGFSSQFGGTDNEKYKIGRMKTFLSTVFEKNLSEQKVLLEQELDSWQKTQQQTDDILVIGVKI